MDHGHDWRGQLAGFGEIQQYVKHSKYVEVKNTLPIQSLHFVGVVTSRKGFGCAGEEVFTTRKSSGSHHTKNGCHGRGCRLTLNLLLTFLTQKKAQTPSNPIIIKKEDLLRILKPLAFRLMMQSARLWK